MFVTYLYTIIFLFKNQEFLLLPLVKGEVGRGFLKIHLTPALSLLRRGSKKFSTVYKHS